MQASTNRPVHLFPEVESKPACWLRAACCASLTCP